MFKFLRSSKNQQALVDSVLSESAILEGAEESEREAVFERVEKLKRLLASTDYVGLNDYDKDQTEIKTQRQAWRDEIRELSK